MWPFRLEPLNTLQNRSGFTSGNEVLDRYFETQVSQDVRRRVTSCFVAIDSQTEQIAGFYTLESANVGKSLVSQQNESSTQHRQAYCMLVDAKNEVAAAFYEHHGFQRPATQQGTLFLPLATADKWLIRR